LLQKEYVLSRYNGLKQRAEEILKKQYSYNGIVSIGLAVAVVIAIVVITLTNSARANSSAGVVTVSDYEATISKGDTLVLTSKSGKTTNYWHVTYDGDQTVTATKEPGVINLGPSPDQHSEKLCGVGCERQLNVQPLLGFTIIERADHRVSVKWSWRWGYRRH
jgi:hypothetical protein